MARKKGKFLIGKPIVISTHVNGIGELIFHFDTICIDICIKTNNSEVKRKKE